jgi:hypothetical protein
MLAVTMGSARPHFGQIAVRAVEGTVKECAQVRQVICLAAI